MGSDEGLAPVTYLFGARPSSARPEPDEPELDEFDDDGPAPDVPESDGLEPDGLEPDGLEPDGLESTGLESTGPESGTSERAARRAENVAMRALTRRGLSRREVERTLRARELDEAAIADELQRLEGVGLVDDMALAQDLVARLQERKGYGRSAIAAELTRRLLSPAAIEYALELVEASGELARARELAVKRAGQLRGYDRDTAVRRLSGYLSRRGYDGSTVRTAVEHALSEHPSRGSVRFR